MGDIHGWLRRDDWTAALGHMTRAFNYIDSLERDGYWETD